MRFSCPKCSQSITCDESCAGRKAKCPKCGQRLLIPTPPVPKPENKTILGKLESDIVPESEVFLVEDGSASAPKIQHFPAVIPIPEVIRVPEVNQAEKPSLSDAENSFYCLACKYPLRFRRTDRGKVLRCPSCLYYFKAPGRRRRGEPDGLPIPVTLSAERIIWPICCACCLGVASDFLKATANKVDANDLASAAWAMHYNNYGYAILKAMNSRETKWWPVPYCLECIDHINKDSDEIEEDCCCIDAAVRFDGWHGHVQKFSFFNWQYANRFMLANHEKRLI